MAHSQFDGKVKLSFILIKKYTKYFKDLKILGFEKQHFIKKKENQVNDFKVSSHQIYGGF